MKKAIWPVFGLLIFVSSASAQNASRVELSTGYSYFRAGFSGGVNQQGGNFTVAGNVNRWFGIVGDFGAYHAQPGGSSFNTYTFLGGPRFSARNASRVTPFAQVLVGGAHLTAGGGFSGAVTPFAVAAGGGVELDLTRNLALRQELDYIAMHSNGDTLHCARASLGVVFRFGGR